MITQFLGYTLVALALVGCSSAPDSAERLQGTWTTTKAPSVTSSDQFDLSATRITFRPDGTWRAFDGCNRLSGTYAVEGTSFSSEGGSSAGIGCSGGQVPFDLLLTRADHLAFDDAGSVTFQSSRNVTLLVLASADDAR